MHACHADSFLTVLSVSCRFRVPPVACTCSGYTSRVGCMSVTLTLGPLTGLNRLDSTSSSSYSTGTFHTHADGGVSGGAESSARADASVTAEAFTVEVEFVRLLLPRSLLKSASALRPTLAGLHPTEASHEGMSEVESSGQFQQEAETKCFALGCKYSDKYTLALFEILGFFLA